MPTSIGYGMARGGRTALAAALSSCAPGVVAANVDNGYGAACAAVKIVRCFPREEDMGVIDAGADGIRDGTVTQHLDDLEPEV